MIPTKINSGKIGDRFSFKIRSPIFSSNRIPVFPIPHASPSQVPDRTPLPGIPVMGCTQRSPKPPPIAPFYGMFDTISPKNDTIVSGFAHFTHGLPDTCHFRARNLRSPATIHGIIQGPKGWGTWAIPGPAKREYGRLFTG